MVDPFPDSSRAGQLTIQRRGERASVAASRDARLALDLAGVGSKIGASVLTPSAIDTAIAHTARVRDDRYGTDESEDNAFVVESLSKMTAEGISPADVVGPVMAGIRAGDFLIPTKPSYANQIQVRYDALLERRIPPTAEVD